MTMAIDICPILFIKGSYQIYDMIKCDQFEVQHYRMAEWTLNVIAWVTL